MTNQPQPILTEHITSENGDYTQEWYCEPPAKGIGFHVIRDIWTTREPITRKIYEIKIGDVW